MNSSSRSRSRKGCGCGCCPVFFSIKVDMCLRCPPPFTLFPSARLLPPSTSICFMRQVKLKIAHLKFVERERERVSAAGKVRAQRRNSNLRLTGLRFFAWHSAAPRLGRETGKWFFLQTAEMILIALAYQSIWCSAKRFNWEIPWDDDRKNIKKIIYQSIPKIQLHW